MNIMVLQLVLYLIQIMGHMIINIDLNGKAVNGWTKSLYQLYLANLWCSAVTCAIQDTAAPSLTSEITSFSE